MDFPINISKSNSISLNSRRIFTFEILNSHTVTDPGYDNILHMVILGIAGTTIAISASATARACVRVNHMRSCVRVCVCAIVHV